MYLNERIISIEKIFSIHFVLLKVKNTIYLINFWKNLPCLKMIAILKKRTYNRENIQKGWVVRKETKDETR